MLFVPDRQPNVHSDAYLLFRRVLFARRTADVFYMLLGRPVRPGFMSHLRSLDGLQ